MYQILRYNFVHPLKKNNKNIKEVQLKLTNGNDSMLKGQIDLKIPGGTKSILPVCCRTTFVFIVPSKFSLALQTKFVL